MRRGKPWLCGVLCACVLLSCLGCETEDDRYFNQLVAERKAQLPQEEETEWRYMGMEPQPGDDLEGEVVIRAYTAWNNAPAIAEFASEFMFQHPAVKVTIDWELELSETPSRARHDAFLQQVRVEMASGAADYVFFGNAADDWGINVPAMTRAGLLEDFNLYLRDSQELSQDSFYQPVLEAMQVDGWQTALPLSFQYTAMTFDRERLGDIGVTLDSDQPVTPRDVMDWYGLALEREPDLGLFYASPTIDTMFDLERTAYMDLEDKSCSFDSQPFVDYLTQLTTIQNQEPDLDPQYVGGDHLVSYALDFYYYHHGEPLMFEFLEDVSQTAAHAKDFFACPHEARPCTLLTKYEPLDYLAGPYPLTNSQGALGITCQEFFLLPGCVQDKELAWEFIQYCAGDREDPRMDENSHPWYYTYYFPANRHNMAAMAEDAADGTGLSMVEEGFATSVWELDQQEYLDRLEELLSKPLVFLPYYEVDTQEFFDELVVNRLTTPEQCAEKIQDRVTIKLNE